MCLSAISSLVLLAAPEWEKGETWRRFGSMSCIPGRSEIGCKTGKGSELDRGSHYVGCGQRGGLIDVS